MINAMEVLFIYANEHMVRSLLEQDPEFCNTRSCVERQENSFRALLDGEILERFEKLATEQVMLNLINERAAFRAGFLIALELGR